MHSVFSSWRQSSLLVTLLYMLYLVHIVKSRCATHQFECANGRCVPISWNCDDDNDCGDNSDEGDCVSRTCSSSEFKCANFKCVPHRWICDDEDDCGDKSDETGAICQNKTCAPNQFSCTGAVGMCIPITWRCDGQSDCPDGSDEKEDCKQITCTEEEFTCHNNKCITKAWYCDQDNDCGDGSDEISCPNVTCSSSEFMCSNGRCIPERWRCDGDVDCPDNSDEQNCPKQISRCEENKEFTCASRDCIHRSWVCDGDTDCPDGSDEKNCTVVCRADQFHCRNNHCIHGTLQCNGVKDCKDGSDEEQCPTKSPLGCNKDTNFDCGHHHCIPINLVCNGKNDCGNWEDEPQGKCNRNECQINNGGCSQKCVDTVAGYECDCYSGYQLADNRTCEDINECEIAGFCSQICENTKGSFKCHCIPGYSIEPANHHRCKAQVGHVSLLFANRHDIRRINLETSEYVSVVSGLRSTVSLGYHFQSNDVVWTDVSEETIKRAPISTGSPVTTLINSEILTPDGIAVDWIYNHIYWTDTGRNTLELADMNGNNRKLLLSENLDEPRAIVLDPLEGWMYWTDWGEPAKIERAGMDGSHRSVIIDTDIRWPNGLAIDFVSRKLFWADAKLHVLCSSNYDGSNQKVIISSSSVVKHPFSVDVFEDWLFWTDWETEAIHKVNKFTGQELTDVAVGVFSPMAVHVFHSYKQPAGVNHCRHLNGGCSHLCLPAPKLTKTSANYTCACPTNMIMQEDSKTCISKDVTTTPVRTTTRISSVQPSTSPSSIYTYLPSRPYTFRTSSTTSTTTTSTTTTTPRQAYSSTQKSKTFYWWTTKQFTKATKAPTYESSTVSTTAISTTTDDVVSPDIRPNESLGYSKMEHTFDDNGTLAGTIIGVLIGITIIISLIAFLVYRQCSKNTITSMNFDNPVYRKTTEDQFSLEKNQYHPAGSYPPSLEPLTSPGTNEFV